MLPTEGRHSRISRARRDRERSNSSACSPGVRRRLTLLALASATASCGAIASGPSDSSGGASGTDDAGTSVIVKQVTVGRSISCALLSDGTVKCWGYNADGQIGIDHGCLSTSRAGNCNPLWATSPVTVQGLSGAVRIDAGYDTVCAVLGDGTARCWGNNDGGKLGDGTTTDNASPVMVQGLSNVAAVAARTSCALLEDGTVSCWGRGNLTPVVVQGLSGVLGVTGGLHTCALLSEGTVACWGSNQYGELGDGTNIDRVTPVVVPGLSGVVEITGNGAHTCARLNEGTVRCWGANGYGQLGDGTNDDRSTPVTVQGLSDIIETSAGGQPAEYGAQTCARLANRTLACWGSFRGPEDLVPIVANGVVDSAVGIGAIDATGTHTCALLQDNTVMCWGDNLYGQLGNGTRTSSPTPVFVQGLL